MGRILYDSAVMTFYAHKTTKQKSIDGFASVEAVTKDAFLNTLIKGDDRLKVLFSSDASQHIYMYYSNLMAYSNNKICFYYDKIPELFLETGREQFLNTGYEALVDKSKGHISISELNECIDHIGNIKNFRIHKLVRRLRPTHKVIWLKQEHYLFCKADHAG